MNNNLDTMQNRRAQERREHEIYQRELSIFFFGAITMGVIVLSMFFLISTINN